METPPENDVCCVCHDSFTLPCQANCSHWFCGQCILRVWHHGSALQPCKCPICRRHINLLVPSEATVDQRNDSETSHVLENIGNYNRLFGGGSHSLMQRLRDMPFFLRRLLREFMDPQRSLPLVIRARMCFAVALIVVYLVSPVDFLPKGILGLVGWFDDFFTLLITFLHLAAIYRTLLYYLHDGS